MALAAILALVLMPTAGRLYQADRSDDGGPGNALSIAMPITGHGDHATVASRDAAPPESPVAPDKHSAHADCPYCPLLGQLASAAHPLPLPARVPGGPAPLLAVTDGHAALRPHGLHARGPPTPA